MCITKELLLSTVFGITFFIFPGLCLHVALFMATTLKAIRAKFKLQEKGAITFSRKHLNSLHILCVSGGVPLFSSAIKRVENGH
jgi:hypothetical protein